MKEFVCPKPVPSISSETIQAYARHHLSHACIQWIEFYFLEFNRYSDDHELCVSGDVRMWFYVHLRVAIDWGERMHAVYVNGGRRAGRT